MKKRHALTALTVALASTLFLGGCKVEPPDVNTEITTNENGETSPAKPNPTKGNGDETQPMVREQHTFGAAETSLFIYRDGRVESLETDDYFDKEYYSLDEFRNDMVNPVIVSYNSANGADAVALSALTLQDTRLQMKILCKTAKDYLAFNKSFNEFFGNWNVFAVCKVSEAAANGIDIAGAFTDAKGNAITSSKIKEICGDYYVCAVNFGGALPSGVSGKFFTEGNIYYLSNGLSMDTENSVTLTGTEGIQYIIFY